MENTIAVRVYLALFELEIKPDVDGDVSTYLNESGYASLTVCPECHVDDFTHVEGCKVQEQVDELILKSISK